MDHLKRFNESVGDNLSFEGFKDIMHILTDLTEDDPDFKDYSNTQERVRSKSYMCEITIPKIREEEDDIDISLGYISRSIPGYPHRSDRMVNNHDYEEIGECIDYQIDYLKNCINNIEDVIKTSQNIKSHMEIYKNEIVPRFERCDNFLETNVGFNITASKLRITFEIKS